MSVPAGVPLAELSPKVRVFVDEYATLCTPSRVHVCTGYDAEFKALIQVLLDNGVANPLPKLENW